MDDELRALFLATELRAHLVTLPPKGRKRLVDAILECICHNCGMPEGHAFCGPDAEESYYESFEVVQARPAPVPYEDKRPYASYVVRTEGIPATLEEWLR